MWEKIWKDRVTEKKSPPVSGCPYMLPLILNGIPKRLPNTVEWDPRLLEIIGSIHG